jgi:predicted SAM-dependent methyltransferase
MSDAANKVVLHVGCGPPNPHKLHPVFRDGSWREVRLDINPDVQPDVIASTTDMSAVADATAEAVWSSHNLEHLFAHEVPVALAEFRRVLKPGGFVLITLPDLQTVCELLVLRALAEADFVNVSVRRDQLDLWARGFKEG